jgi:hypothetical protein
MDAEERLLEAWKTTVEVQKHFNEIEMRIRNVAITVLAAFLGAAGYTTKENLQIEVSGVTFSLTTAVLLAAAICWMSFYFVDGHWYHRLLRGAVKHGLSIEKALATTAPELGLTTAIGNASPVVIAGRKWGPLKTPRISIRSGTRLAIFYWTICIILLVAALLSVLDEKHVAPIQVRSNPVQQAANHCPKTALISTRAPRGLEARHACMSGVTRS